MTRQHRQQHDSAATSHNDSAAPSPAWLGRTITRMTQNDKAPRLNRLGSYITNKTQQCRHQHDSAATLHCGQVASAAPTPAWLDSTVTNMTRQRHHTTINVASVTSSPAWFNIDITLQTSCLGSAIGCMTWHRHHATAWSSTSTTTYVLSGKQTRC
jgi:hypothetical protein